MPKKDPKNFVTHSLLRRKTSRITVENISAYKCRLAGCCASQFFMTGNMPEGVVCKHRICKTRNTEADIVRLADV
jgi:hypothetical protein